MYRISKQFHFSAAHALTQLADDHPCKRSHGHNYTVDVIFEAESLDERAFVVDFLDLAPIKRFIDEELDHRDLNEVLPVVTSSENIARYLYDRFKPAFPALVAVRVGETPKTWAEYSER